MKRSSERIALLLCYVAGLLVNVRVAQGQGCVTLEQTPDLQSLREALATAGLPSLAQFVAQNGGGSPVTLLAPTDAAFAAFEAAHPNASPVDLETVVRAHVLQGTGPVYQTSSDGFNVTRNAGSSSVQYNAADIANLLSEHAICDAAVESVWLIDTVVVPPNFMSSGAGAPCETFMEGISGNGNLTLLKLSFQMAFPDGVPDRANAFLAAEYEAYMLAPDDRTVSAFAEMMEALNPASWDVEFIRWILYSHWWSDTAFDPDASGPQNVTAFNGELLTVDLTAKTVQWGNAMANIYEAVDICNNSTLFLVDAILMPAEFAPDSANPTPPTQEESGPLEESGPDPAEGGEASRAHGVAFGVLATLPLLLLSL